MPAPDSSVNDAAIQDTSVPFDAGVVFPPEVDACKDPIFIANFDSPNQAPNADWEDIINLAANDDGGAPISGGTAALIPGGTRRCVRA